MSAGSNPVVWLDLELADDETPLGRIELVRFVQIFNQPSHNIA